MTYRPQEIEAKWQARWGEQRADSAALRARMQARRAELQAKRQQLQPVVAQLRENAQKTRREVESVLTSEQVAKLRELENVRRQAGERGQRSAR